MTAMLTRVVKSHSAFRVAMQGSKQEGMEESHDCDTQETCCLGEGEAETRLTTRQLPQPTAAATTQAQMQQGRITSNAQPLKLKREKLRVKERGTR